MEDSGNIDPMMKPQDVGGINKTLYRVWKSNQLVEKTL
jgi:hypothetical protein